MDVTIHQLPQEEADTLMKRLDVNREYYQNFYEAFHDERRHISDRNRTWALPHQERSYYLIGSYLFGVKFKNPDIISLSSFALVLPRNPSHDCASCLRLLFKQILIPFCRDHKKRCISAALTEKGKTVFEDLKRDFPSLEIANGRPYHFASLACGADVIGGERNATH